MQSVILKGWGSNEATFMQVDPTYDALRASIRPIETQTDPQGPFGGHYFVSAPTGTLSATIANSAQLWQVRWADPTKLFVLKKLTVQAMTLTNFSANTIGCPLQLFIGHGSTANGSGGTAVSVVAGKGRATQGSTSFVTSGEIRVAGTGGCTAATGQTLEGQPVGGCAGAPVSGQSVVMNLFEQRDFGDHPLVLTAGDTLAVLTGQPAPSATGTATFFFNMSWAETVTY
jgi:hypothetical protein